MRALLEVSPAGKRSGESFDLRGMCGGRAGAPTNPLDPSAIPKALPSSRFDCCAGFLHQGVDQIDVVIREQTRTEHFLCAEEMSEICARKIRARVAIAARVYR